METATIGFNPYNYRKNGSQLVNITKREQIENIVLSAKGREKDNLPCIYTYSGVKGEFTGSNVYFVDIDSREGVDWLMDNSRILFINIPDLLFMQESYSGKLHCVGIMHKFFKDKDEYAYWSKIYTAKFVGAVNFITKTELGEGLNYFMVDKAVDSHNTQWYQAMYVSGNKILWNENHISPEFEPGVEKHCVEYVNSLGLNWFQEKRVTMKTITKTEVGYKVTKGGDKIAVHTDLANQLGYEYGTDLRFRIMSTLISMFGEEDAKKFVEEHFSNARDIIKSCSKVYGEFANVKYWLMKVFDIQMVLPEMEKSGKEINWMMDVKEDILNELKKWKRIEVVSPTGSGKTTLINDFLAKELNAVVIVPYNATNKLYNKLREVSSTSKESYSKDEPCVMIFDQAVKCDLTGRVIIIDESHALFQERTFRPAAVDLMKKLKKQGSEIIAFSATPTGEVEELDLHMCEYFRKRNNTIRLSAIHTENDMALSQKRLVNYHLKTGRYDRICVFDNRTMKKIYESLVLEGAGDEIAYIRSETQFEKDFMDIKAKETLSKPVNLLTGIAYNGLNFNDAGSVLCIMSFVPGQTIYSEIIQSIGRFRKAKNVDVVLFIQNEDKSRSKKHSVNELAEKANDLFAAGVSSNLVQYDEELTNPDNKMARNFVEDYLEANGKWDLVKEKIEHTGYVYVEELEDKTELDGKLKLKIKRIVSKAWRDDRVNGEKGEYRDNKYYIGWEKETGRLRIDYPFIDDAWLNEMIAASKGELIADTILNNIRDILIVGNMTDEQWDSHLRILNEVLRNADEKNKWYKSELSARIKKLNSIREKYGFIGQSMEQWFQNISCDIDSLFDEYIENKVAAGTAGGKKSSPKKAVSVTYSGETIKFSSKGDADSWLKDHGLSQKELAIFKKNKKCYKVL